MENLSLKVKRILGFHILLSLLPAPKITKELAKLNFAAMDATAVYTLERAISHMFPLSTNWLKTPVKLLDIRPSTCSPPSEIPQPGHIYYNKKKRKINVECCGRTFITFSKVVAKNRTMSSDDFYNGFLSRVPENQRFFSSDTWSWST